MASSMILLQRFSEFDYESLLRENPPANERFEVPDGPLYLEIIQVDFVEMSGWKNH